MDAGRQGRRHKPVGVASAACEPSREEGARKVKEALALLRTIQQDFYAGYATKDDLRWALDNLNRVRREQEPKPIPHNPPVKLR